MKTKKEIESLFDALWQQAAFLQVHGGDIEDSEATIEQFLGIASVLSWILEKKSFVRYENASKFVEGLLSEGIMK